MVDVIKNVTMMSDLTLVHAGQAINWMLTCAHVMVSVQLQQHSDAYTVKSQIYSPPNIIPPNLGLPKSKAIFEINLNPLNVSKTGNMNISSVLDLFRNRIKEFSA